MCYWNNNQPCPKEVKIKTYGAFNERTRVYLTKESMQCCKYRHQAAKLQKAICEGLLDRNGMSCTQEVRDSAKKALQKHKEPNPTTHSLKYREEHRKLYKQVVQDIPRKEKKNHKTEKSAQEVIEKYVSQEKQYLFKVMEYGYI